MEVLRISTVVDQIRLNDMKSLLEVLRISTVVDKQESVLESATFGSTKNFYCCRLSSVISYRKDDNTIEQSELII